MVHFCEPSGWPDASALADRTIECRPAGMHRAADDAAVIPRARLALAVVHREAVLELAELASGADVIAERRAAGGDGRLENVADRRRQPLGRGRRPAGLGRKAVRWT